MYVRQRISLATTKFNPFRSQALGRYITIAIYLIIQLVQDMLAHSETNETT